MNRMKTVKECENGELSCSPKRRTADGNERIRLRGEIRVRMALVQLLAMTIGLLAVAGILVSMTHQEESKEIWLIIAPLISGLIPVAVIGSLSGANSKRDRGSK